MCDLGTFGWSPMRPLHGGPTDLPPYTTRGHRCRHYRHCFLCLPRRPWNSHPLFLRLFRDTRCDSPLAPRPVLGEGRVSWYLGLFFPILHVARKRTTIKRRNLSLKDKITAHCTPIEPNTGYFVPSYIKIRTARFVMIFHRLLSISRNMLFKVIINSWS